MDDSASFSQHSTRMPVQRQRLLAVEAEEEEEEEQENSTYDDVSIVSGLSSQSIRRRLEKRRKLNMPVPSVTEDEETEELNPVLMAIIMRGRRLGCAYVDVNTNAMFVMDDYFDVNDVDLVSVLKLQIQPTLIITTGSQQDNFIKQLRFNGEAAEETNVDIRPTSEFNLEQAREKMSKLQLPPSIVNAPQTDKQMYMASIVRSDNTESVRCAGALITVLRSGNYGFELEDPDAPIQITVHALHIQQYMYINANSFRSLQIFEDELNPNTHSHRSKEGLSVFGILNQTHTGGGKRLLRSWLLRPEQDLDTIKARHDAISLFTDASQTQLVHELTMSIKHIRHMRPIVGRLAQGRATVNDWQAIFKCGFHSFRILKTFEESDACASLSIATRMCAVIDRRLFDLATLLNRIIDFDESVHSHRFVVKPNVDEQLDQLKRVYHGLDDFLSKVAIEVRRSIPLSFAASLNVVYWPQLGYLVAVPLRADMVHEKDFEHPGLTFQFSTKTTVYYRCARTEELDQNLGDLHGLIVDREIEIMYQTQSRVLQDADVLIAASELCVELDCLLGLAEAARRYNYKRPKVVADDILFISNGRHPLQELCVDSFIPNDTRIGAHLQQRLFFITGPNYSGKSVYLKQVALITFMAHVGSFVPADDAIIGLTDKILTRIWTQESVSLSQSTFMIDLHQMASCINLATERSLVIVDEFGKGTRSDDGIGLLTASLKRLAHPPQGKPPRALVSSHFYEIIENQLLYGQPIVFQTMEIFAQNDQMCFLYKLKDGYSTNSWSSHCAIVAGIPKSVVSRAIVVTRQLARRQHIAPLIDEKKEQQEMQVRLELLKIFAAFDCEHDNVQLLREHISQAVKKIESHAVVPDIDQQQ